MCVSLVLLLMCYIYTTTTLYTNTVCTTQTPHVTTSLHAASSPLAHTHTHTTHTTHTHTIHTILHTPTTLYTIHYTPYTHIHMHHTHTTLHSPYNTTILIQHYTLHTPHTPLHTHIHTIYHTSTTLHTHIQLLHSITYLPHKLFTFVSTFLTLKQFHCALPPLFSHNTLLHILTLLLSSLLKPFPQMEVTHIQQFKQQPPQYYNMQLLIPTH